MWMKNKFHTWVQNEIINESQNKLDMKAIKKLNVSEILERKFTTKQNIWPNVDDYAKKDYWKWDTDDDDDILDGT